ncbi:hypothetical protein THAOC_35354 [Thalassiosira oceanica]|uniref:Uncharacterized protein n=1 Tax=Thalassiosira oceanica TaxID=159749 RepID=K0R1X3_THAOC|nr:hypothetical protein THAOC_35354 [Thalassiosira oceanica]|eukprot:EJK46005.1 hypothetical protein THAOC_35354 [Thalassiosira oceanica]
MLPRGEEDHPRRSRRRRPVFYDDDVEGCDAESCSSSHCSSPRRSSHHLPQHIPLDDYGPDQDEGRLFSFIYDLVYAVVHTALTACVNFLDSWRRRRRKRRRNSNTNLNIIEEENSRPRSFRPPDAGIDDIESGMVRGENPRHNYEPEWHNAPSASAPMTPPILKQPTYGPVYGPVRPLAGYTRSGPRRPAPLARSVRLRPWGRAPPAPRRRRGLTDPRRPYPTRCIPTAARTAVAEAPTIPLQVGGTPTLGGTTVPLTTFSGGGRAGTMSRGGNRGVRDRRGRPDKAPWPWNLCLVTLSSPKVVRGGTTAPCFSIKLDTLTMALYTLKLS